MDEELVEADSILGDLIALTDPDAVLPPGSSRQGIAADISPSRDEPALPPATGDKALSSATVSSKGTPGLTASSSRKDKLSYASNKLGITSSSSRQDKLSNASNKLGLTSSSSRQDKLSNASNASDKHKVGLASASSRKDQVGLSYATGASRNDSSPMGSAPRDKRVHPSGPGENHGLVSSALPSRHDPASSRSGKESIKASIPSSDKSGSRKDNAKHSSLSSSKDRSSRDKGSKRIVPFELATKLRDVGKSMEYYRLSSVSQLGDLIEDLGIDLMQSKKDRATLHAAIVRVRERLGEVWNEGFKLKDLC